MGRTGAPPVLPLARSVTQARILELLFLQPRREWTVSELADDVGVTPVPVRRELERLVRASIAVARPVGRALVYAPDTASPLFEPLQQLVERSVGVEAQLRTALQAMPGVRAAAIYGSWAREDVDAASDIDLLIVGDLDHGALAEGLHAVAMRIGREINPVVLGADELQSDSGFLRDVAASPMTPLIGNIELDPERH